MIAYPEVTVLSIPTVVIPSDIMVTHGDPGQADTPEDLLEFAGRACYQSFSKPNPNTRTPGDYLRNIIAQGHESVLEHAQVSLYITGVSRAFTHELIRHRHLSYSQLSQRFVDETEARVTLPPNLEGFHDLETRLEESAREALGLYELITSELLDFGYTRKEAREAARAVLPNCVETRIVVSGNLRAWRDFLKKRLDPAADAEIQTVAELILDKLLLIAPHVFEDIDHNWKETTNP